MPTEPLTHSESIVVARAPEDLYDLVSDITNMGEWSPVCKECVWEEGSDGPGVGAFFTGRNELPAVTWETRCEVVAAEPGREFAWIVGPGFARWGYTFAAVDDGTELTETWEFLPAGIAFFEERFGDDAPTQIANRREAARSGIPATLAAIKLSAETT